MLSDIEDEIVAECRRQGLQPTADAMRRVAIDFAGSTLVNGFIVMPNRRSISVRDAVSSLRTVMPEGFRDLADTQPSDSMTATERMIAEVHRQRATALPTDWADVRKRYKGSGNLTGSMMDEIEALRRQGEAVR